MDLHAPRAVSLLNKNPQRSSFLQPYITARCRSASPDACTRTTCCRLKNGRDFVNPAQSLRIRLTSEVRKRNATPSNAKIVPTQSEALNRRQPGALDLSNLHLAKSARVGVLDR
jgi:hypothetical protein